MNTAEKLKFLADRAEDGKEFYMRENHLQFINGELKIIHYNQYFNSNLSLELISKHNFYLPPQWSFTEDEKVILRNVKTKYKYLVRDSDGTLVVYTGIPRKEEDKNETEYGEWVYGGDYEFMDKFSHIFQSIQWSDDEPCEFRRYI